MYYNLNFDYEDLEEMDWSSLINSNNENYDDDYNENVLSPYIK